MAETSSYFSQSRREMLQFLPDNPSTLIDIGCAEGFFAAAVKERFPSCEVWGLEPDAVAADKAAKRCDRLIYGHFSESAELPIAYYDVVTMNDVLEHVPYSEPALALVKKILKPDGVLVLSLPNVAYYLNIRDLVFYNEWEYRDFGILDRTHLRFFTERSATRLLARNGFSVKEVRGVNGSSLKIHYRLLFSLLPKLTGPMRFAQFAVVARVGNGSDAHDGD